MTYKIQIDDLVRDADENETAQIDARKAQHDAEKQADADRQALKTATLAKLGLTADEVAALLS
jgi:DNA-binding protein YbaB